MIVRNEERNVKVREAMREGPGSVLVTDICSKEEMFDKSRTYAQMLLKKDCGIGYHVHENEKEIFLVNKGRAVYNDNGTEYEVGPGDVLVCEDGQGHAITNYSDEDCEVIALILLK